MEKEGATFVAESTSAVVATIAMGGRPSKIPFPAFSRLRISIVQRTPSRFGKGKPRRPLLGLALFGIFGFVGYVGDPRDE